MSPVSRRPFQHDRFSRSRSSGFKGNTHTVSAAPNLRNQHVKKWPQVGEIVIARIDKVLDYGVFCALLEYEGATGFVHISQVESAWIKNIRNHVKEGQLRVALVQKVDLEKLQIDLSLTKVSERQQRLRIEEYKQLERNKKLVEVMAKTLNKSLGEGWSIVAEPLIKMYGSLPLAFEAIAMDGASAAEGIAKEWIPILVETVQKNVRPTEKEVKGTLSIACTAPDGVERVKSALLSGAKGVHNANVCYSYLGAGKYLVKVISFDYKLAEKALASVQEKVQKNIGSFGTMSFVRQEA
ncbi:MAG: S1 RNA-binding domain-containing protein [Candidatus Diapherotrites archaeon]